MTLPAKSHREPFCIRCSRTERDLRLACLDFRAWNARHRIGICTACGADETLEQLTAAIAQYIKDAKATFAHEVAKP